MIIDSHVHIIRDELYKKNYVFDIEENNIEKTIFKHKESPEALEKAKIPALIKSMNESNINKSIIMGLPWVKEDNCKKDNDFVAETLEKFPELFYGYGVIQPLKTKSSIKEIERCHKMGFKGIKIIPNWQGFSLDDKKLMNPIMESLLEKDMVLLPHIEHSFRISNGDMPHHLFTLCKNHPKNKIIASHLGGMLFMYLLYEKTANVLKNLYFDISVSASMKMVKYAIEIINEDKLIFGTDYPFNSNHSQNIMLENFLSLLKNYPKDKYLSQNILTIIGEL